MRLLIALWVGSLVACHGPTIDGSSSQTTEASVAVVKQELAPEDQVRLEEALRTIVARELGSAMRGGFGTPSGAHDVDERVAALLHGKTAAEVIAYAEDLRAQPR